MVAGRVEPGRRNCASQVGTIDAVDAAEPAAGAN